MKNFNDLKKKAGAESLGKLTAELEKMNAKGAASDNDSDLYWKPSTDKAGNGYAVIRFLPAPQGEDLPFVRLWHHAFKGNGGWYIENSLTTIGQQDPIGELNSSLWSSGNEADKATVRKQKRNLTYYSNIYVVKDPANPDNEGKVFLFKYGKKIFDKINDLMNPSYDDEEPINPFDFWMGANFKLKIRQVEGYRNYDKSEFDTAGPLFEQDSELENIWKQQHSLQKLVDPSNFKTYEELKIRLHRALGTAKTASAPQTPPPAHKQQEAAQAPSSASSSTPPWDDEDEDVDFFKRLSDSIG